MNKIISEQHGSALAMAVLILVVLTIVGLAAVTTSNLAMDSAGNLKAKTQSYHAAEACMYYQVRQIKNSVFQCVPNGCTGSFSLGNGLTCSSTQPSSTGAYLPGSGSMPVGMGLGGGTGGSGIAYQFTVTGVGPRSTSTTMDVTIRLPVVSGSYGT